MDVLPKIKQRRIGGSSEIFDDSYYEGIADNIIKDSEPIAEPLIDSDNDTYVLVTPSIVTQATGNIWCYSHAICETKDRIKRGNEYELKRFQFYYNKAKSENKITIKLATEEIAEFPRALNKIAENIEKSKYILELENNWDGEGASKFKKNIWIKVVHFIATYSQYAFNEKNIAVGAPVITPLFDNSIDILWENEDYILIINITSNGREMSAFYHDNHKAFKRKGTFEVDKIDDEVLGYLLKMT